MTTPPARRSLPRPHRLSPVWRVADMVRHLAVRLATRHRHLYSLGAVDGHGALDESGSLARWIENVDIGLHPGVSLLMRPGAALRFRVPEADAGRLSAQLAVLPMVRLMAPEEVRFEVSLATPAGAVRSTVERSVRGGPPRHETARAWIHERIPRGGGELVLRVHARAGAPPLWAVWINPAVFSRARAERPPDLRLLRDALGRLRPRDLYSAVRRLERFLRSVSPQTYLRELDPSDRLRLRLAAEATRPPRLSLLVAPEVLPIERLLATLRSIRAQSFEDWEVLFCPARQSNESAVRAVADLVGGDPRLRFLPAPDEPGLAAAMNAALRAATGAFVAALLPGDELPPDALHRFAVALSSSPELDVAYADEELPTGFGDYDVPAFKPGWAPESALSYPYVGRPCFVRAALALELGGWREPTLAAQEYDLVLRAHARGARIAHLRRILFRRRAERMDWFNERGAVAARRTAVADHLSALGHVAEVVDEPGPARLRVRFPIEGSPLVSIVIPTRDKLPLLRRCLESIARRTVYRPFEIVIVDNGSRFPRTRSFLLRCGHRVVDHPGEFNFSAINNHGARAARGEFLLFLNNDTEVVAPGWLVAMLEWAQLPQVGCVGAKLLFPDGRLQHVGIALRDGTAEHPFYRQWPGSQSRWTDTEVVRNCSAVTAACMMVRRSLFEELGGFDEAFPVNYQDVDFCLRLAERGRRHVYTPHALLVHRESSSRPTGVHESERQRLRERHGDVLWNDPYWPKPGRYGLVEAADE